MSGSARGLIGPENLGQRVTMRFDLPDGPSEAVGVLREWPTEPSGDLIVENRRGDLIRVPVAAITAARVIG